MLLDLLVILGEAASVLLLVAGCALSLFSVFVGKGYNGNARPASRTPPPRESQGGEPRLLDRGLRGAVQ